MDLKGLQKAVDEWIQQHGVRYFNELTNMAQLTEEVGEVARIVARRYGEQSEKENDKNKDFLFFCGKERRPDLEAQMEFHKIKLDVVVVYQTKLKPKPIGAFDIVLFYSPSGVRSFLKDNSLKQTVCICIGPTTAEALPISKRQIIIATSPTIEHMIYQTKKQLPS